MIFIFLMQMAFAAPHSSFPDRIDPVELKTRLIKNEIEEIKKMGPRGYEALIGLMKSENESVEHRWNAVLAVAKIGGTESLADIRFADQNPTWFMRSAGLLAHSLIDLDKGVSRAKNLIHTDGALLVRAAALQVIAQDPQMERDFLWAELYNPLNFKNGRSLSLRLSLLKVLEKNALKKELPKFVALSQEKDEEIRNYSKQIIEKTLLAKTSSR